MSKNTEKNEPFTEGIEMDENNIFEQKKSSKYKCCIILIIFNAFLIASVQLYFILLYPVDQLKKKKSLI